MQIPLTRAFALSILAFNLCLNAHAQEKQPASVVIANVSIQAGGCQATAKTYEYDVPSPELIDASKGGKIINGFSFDETTRVSDSGVRNVSFGGNKLRFELYANGKGAIQNVPCPTFQDPFRTCPGPCVGAEGASVGYRITAYYKQQPPKPSKRTTAKKRNPGAK